MRNDAPKPSIDADSALIPLRARDGHVRAWAIVDAADYAAIAERPWKYQAPDKRHRSAYATGQILEDGRWRYTNMHAQITGWAMTDHIDGDGLNNRRSNLRPATSVLNGQNLRRSLVNTSGERGVDWHKSHSKWRARIEIAGRRLNLGYFDTRDAAANAVREARAEMMPYSAEATNQPRGRG